MNLVDISSILLLGDKLQVHMYCASRGYEDANMKTNTIFVLSALTAFERYMTCTQHKWRRITKIYKYDFAASILHIKMYFVNFFSPIVDMYHL